VSEVAFAKREFRKPLSLEAERVTRGAIKPFLERRGFTVGDHRRRYGNVESQVISATAGNGDAFRARVRICWNRRDRRDAGAKYAAAQLTSDLKGDDWNATLAFVRDREHAEQNTHNLFVQWDEDGFAHMALVPSQALPAIWQRQREVFAELIESGRLGAKAANPAENGRSPTIYLQDDRTAASSAVAKVLWTWPGVTNLKILPEIGGGPFAADDTFDDLPLDRLGRDAASAVPMTRSGVSRDPRVRAVVLQRAGGKCERTGCGQSRPYAGFLDVHHILGVYSSDRVWSCVALCPNCHREAHVAPDRGEINAELQRYASQFTGA
jgi:5-methylcytosine-specific restriction enzyme A